MVHGPLALACRSRAASYFFQDEEQAVMNGSIDFYADDCKVTIETNWTGAGDYQLIRVDGATTPLGDCQTFPDMLSAVLDTEWSSEMEGARVEKRLP